MKLSLVCASLAMMLLGCMSDPALPSEEEETLDEDSVEEESGGPSVGYDTGHGNMCDLYGTMVVTQTINGVEMTVEIPVMCDPNPMIDKGDPPPDRINPGDTVERYENPSTQENNINQDPDTDNTSNLI